MDKMTSIQYKKKILLGSISIIHSNWIPYASGCLISYCNRIPEIKKQYEFLDPIYKYKPPEEYQDILFKTDILGLTCYVWNQNYNDKLAKYYKSIRPDGVVIYGGPQIPENDLLKQNFDKTRKFLDVSIAGLGEIAFAEWLQDLPFSNTTLKEVPTPYTDGVFNNILSSGEKLAVSFETNRGCPYSCAFCDWGGQAKSKLTQFNIEDVYSTIDYIYKFKNIDEVEILDANFGILKRDIDVVDRMIRCQNTFENRIRISYSGLAKNGSKQLPTILGKVFDNIPIRQQNLKLSFQTHTPEVLKIANRDNIKNDRLLPLIKEYKRKNVPTTSELIIALPGETAESWLDTLHYNHHGLEIDYVRTYILHIVANTEMNEKEYQSKYKIKTKKVKYKNQTVEIINSCFSYDLNELIKMFDYHWFYHNLVNTDMARDMIRSVREDTHKFFYRLNEMPILKKLIMRQRELVKRIFAEGDTVLLNDDENRFFSASLRLDDDKYIKENWLNIEKELNETIRDNR